MNPDVQRATDSAPAQFDTKTHRDDNSACITIIMVVIVVIGLGYAQDQDLNQNYTF